MNYTTSDYLEQLQQDREDLVDNLETKGITGLTGDETFTELVPEVLNISGGGGADLNDYFELAPTTMNANTWLQNNYIKRVWPDLTIPSGTTSLTGLHYGWVYSTAPKVICGNNVTNMSNMYSPSSNPSSMNNGKLTTVDLSGLNTSNVTNMGYMFSGLPITTLDFTQYNNLNFNKITTVLSMFSYCKNLSTINLSNLSIKPTGTGNVNLADMFRECTNLTTITFGNDFYDDTNLNASTQIGTMFYGCSGLTSLDLSGLKINHGGNGYYIFTNCKNLTHIDMRNFNFTTFASYNDMFGASASNGVPDNCEIIVADDTQKTWVTGKFSRLTNVKTVAEYEASL